MGMTNFDFFAIIVFGLAVLGLAAWRQIKRMGMEAEARIQFQLEMARDAADKVALDHKKALAIKIDMYNEACNMEPFCGEGKKP